MLTILASVKKCFESKLNEDYQDPMCYGVLTLSSYVLADSCEESL